MTTCTDAHLFLPLTEIEFIFQNHQYNSLQPELAKNCHRAVNWVVLRTNHWEQTCNQSIQFQTSFQGNKFWPKEHCLAKRYQIDAVLQKFYSHFVHLSVVLIICLHLQDWNKEISSSQFSSFLMRWLICWKEYNTQRAGLEKGGKMDKDIRPSYEFLSIVTERQSW